MSPPAADTTSTTASTTAADDEINIRHKKPYDNHMKHVWFFEPKIAKKYPKRLLFSGRGVLTEDGITQIGNHKYVSGSYTNLDSALNPIWTYLTECLPMWLAPNLITSIGGTCCLFSYCVSWYYNPTLVLHTSNEYAIPDWVLVLNGVMQIIYYTLDCMDGKQARRTNTSSPLGQLFDHGIDGLTSITHLSTAQCIVQLTSTYQYMWLQSALQFAFFQAQWEEYYTGILPHTTGQVGVTEVNYGVALWSIVSGLILKPSFYNTTLPTSINTILSNYFTLLLGKSNDGEEETSYQIKHVILVLWVSMLATLSVMSLGRVAKHLNYDMKLIASAYSKLLSPGIASTIAILAFPALPASVRHQSLSFGLCLCLITIKIIVLSMAKMSYASIQIDIVPLVVVSTLVMELTNPKTSVVVVNDHIANLPIIEYSYEILSLYYLLRIVYWAHKACTQLCQRLNISMFTIPSKKKE